MDYVKCCFCGAEIPENESNNPQPLDIQEGARCCNACNYKYVISCRIAIDTLLKGYRDIIDNCKNGA